jgi:hypothetical protein
VCWLEAGVKEGGWGGASDHNRRVLGPCEVQCSCAGWHVRGQGGRERAAALLQVLEGGVGGFTCDQRLLQAWG